MRALSDMFPGFQKPQMAKFIKENSVKINVIPGFASQIHSYIEVVDGRFTKEEMLVPDYVISAAQESKCVTFYFLQK